MGNNGTVTLTHEELNKLLWRHRQYGARKARGLNPKEDEILEYVFTRCAKFNENEDACRDCHYLRDGSCERLAMKLINRITYHVTDGRTIIPIGREEEYPEVIESLEVANGKRNC